MTKMLRFIAALIGLALLVQGAVYSDPQAAQTNGARIAAALNLTDSQKTQLKPLLESIHEQFRAIRNDSTLSMPQKRQKMMLLRLQMRTQIDEILTPAQQQQLKLLREQFKKSWQARQKGTTPT
jgi:Spy/CpxP family protein refolding chaperone